MTTACPCCGSVAVKRNGRSAACMNPRCPDNGIIKPVQVFRLDSRQHSQPCCPPDPRKVACGGGTRTLPAFVA